MRPLRPSSFSTLASIRRRLLLRELFERERTMSVTSLTRKLVHEQSDADARRLSAQLYHSHLPKLEDAGFVTVEGDTVTLTERGSVLEPYLALTEQYETVKR
ncbi:DUF7344 domain-containing protein [Haladaptatus halobius]|uniref:DUF7344 domain-containing protein n=1 Tax=Haladaptatus halobius TaxID=2884875 RepID=UPI003F61B156